MTAVRSIQLDPGVGPGLSRRAFDVVAGLFGLLIVGLPLLVLMIAIRLTSPGPALFRQIRLGQGGRPFALVKLRSMRVGASGPEVTAAGDTRVTPLGRFLRSTSLDELPQLWHVVRGHMTLVGPRPETPALAAAYPPECQWIFRYRPGLTGPAQVRLRDRDVLPPGALVDTSTYLTRLVPARVALDAQFLAQPTLRAAAGVVADTVRHILGRPVPSRRPVIPAQRRPAL
jgi:lipopolysaccharide/colanic/teichoic acid biosynthesis glycosyltransferase